MVSGFHSRFSHDAHCPEISPVDCNEQYIPDHSHDLSTSFLNVQNQIFYSPGRGVQLGLSLPLKVRNTRINYYLNDTGESYTPPYAGLHHRDEVLLGFGDAEFSVQYFYDYNNWFFGVGVNTSLPFGRIEENPYALGEQSRVHQHFQMGTGTFVPSSNVSFGWSHLNKGVLGDYRIEIPFYENKYAYQTGRAHRWSIGHWRKLTPKFTLLGQFLGNHQDSDTWLGYTAPFSGMHSVGIGFSSMFRFQPDKEILFRVQRNIWQKALSAQLGDGEGEAPPYVLFTLGYSWL